MDSNSFFERKLPFCTNSLDFSTLAKIQLSLAGFLVPLSNYENEVLLKIKEMPDYKLLIMSSFYDLT